MPIFELLVVVCKGFHLIIIRAPKIDPGVFLITFSASNHLCASNQINCSTSRFLPCRNSFGLKDHSVLGFNIFPN